MEMIGRIRRMHARGKKSEREISQATGLSRNTVAKWLHEPVQGAPKYQRERRAAKLTPYHEALKQALKAGAHRPKQERRTARALYAEIKAAGHEGGYARVTDSIREWRQGEGQGVLTKAFVPLAFELGEAFQFDWSEEGLVGGEASTTGCRCRTCCCAPPGRPGWWPTRARATRCCSTPTRAASQRWAVLPGAASTTTRKRRSTGLEGQGPQRQRTLCGGKRCR